MGANGKKLTGATLGGGLLTVKEVAHLTGWRPSTVRQKIWRRQISFVRLQGRSIRFRPEVIAKLIADSEVPARESR